MKIFLSYCHKDKVIADRLDAALQKECGIVVGRDERDVSPWDSFSEFMNQAYYADLVMLIISDNYLKSRNCMYEVREAMRNPNYKDKIIPVIVDEDIYNRAKHAKYVKYWQDEANKLTKDWSEIEIANLGSFPNEMRLYRNIAASIGDFLETVTDKNNPSMINGKDQVIKYLKVRLNAKSGGIKENAVDYFKQYGIPEVNIPKHYSDLEKEEFARTSFFEVVKGLENICNQYSNGNSIVSIKTQRIVPDDLIISIYVRGTYVNSFRVGYGGRHFGLGIVAVYTLDDTNVHAFQRSGRTFNALYCVEVADGVLKLRSTFALSSSGQYMTSNDVVGDIWKSRILPSISGRVCGL